MQANSTLVLGHGELGAAIVRSLAKHSSRTKLAVLTRSAVAGLEGRSDDLKSTQIECVTGDIVNDSIDQLAAVFSRYHTVVIANGMNLPPGSQMKIARAIIQASSTTSKPRRYFPWQFGISYDEIGRDSGQNLFDEQLDVRDLLRSQTSVSWVIVSTGMFISFLFEPSFGLVNAERTAVTAIGSWDNALTVTAPEDIGRITAELVLSHGNVQGIVYTAGDTVSFHQLAGIMEDVKGGPITKHLKTVEQLEADLAAQPDDGMRKYRLVFGRGVGVAWEKAKSFNGAHGIPTVSVEEWAHANL